MPHQKHVDILEGIVSRLSALIGDDPWAKGHAAEAREWELEQCLRDAREELGRASPSADRLAILWRTRASWLASLAPRYVGSDEGYSRLMASSGQLSRCAEMLADAVAEEFL